MGEIIGVVVAGLLIIAGCGCIAYAVGQIAIELVRPSR